jgi:hypothetical protein
LFVAWFKKRHAAFQKRFQPAPPALPALTADVGMAHRSLKDLPGFINQPNACNVDLNLN